jgi:anti-anti-sigma factor
MTGIMLPRWGNSREALMDTAKLELDARETPQGIVAILTGDASVDHIDELEQHMRMLSQFPPGVLVLDLSGVTYISSIGLGVLIRYRNQIQEKGGKMKLAALSPTIVDAFRNAKLERVFEIHPSVDAALQK